MEFTLIAVLLLSAIHVNCQRDIILNFSAQSERPNNIVEGDDVVFVCQVSPPFNDATDTLLIDALKSDGGSTVLAQDSDASQNIRWSNNILELTVMNITRHNHGGKYRCIVVRDAMPIDRITITIDVLYHPSGLPKCNTFPVNADLTFYDGDEIPLRCTSDAGNPVVTLTWSYSKPINLSDAEMQILLPGIVISDINVTLFSSVDGIILTCSRFNTDSPSNQDNCNIGPLTVLRYRPTTLDSSVLSSTIHPTTNSRTTVVTTVSPDSTDADVGVDVGVIAAIAVVASIVVMVIVIVVVCLVRSGRCESHSKDSRVENVSLDNGYNGKPTPEDHGQDNPATTVQHVQSPNGGQLYAVVQKNKPSEETSSSGDASKVYPEAPVYARPDKSRHSAAGSGDIYANAGDAASESTPNDSDASSMALYANHSYANPNNSSQTSAPSESPPASPGKTKTPSMSQTPELAYADLDLTRPASNATEKRGTVSSDESSLYASVN